MINVSLKNARIVVDSRNKSGYQDYMEVEGDDGKKYIITASPGGQLIVGSSIE